LTAEKISAISREGNLRDGRVYAVLSFVIGITVGLSTVVTGLNYYYAGWPAHGPVGVVGVFFMIFGLLTVLGSILVLIRKVRLVGAVLILIFGLMSGSQGMGIFVSNALVLVLGWLLPIAGCLFALYAWKLERARTAA
jgi:hypothetical protein